MEGFYDLLFESRDMGKPLLKWRVIRGHLFFEKVTLGVRLFVLFP